MSDQQNIGNADLEQIISKAAEAQSTGTSALSTAEALAAALVLNRPDWIASMNYTLAEALERIGPSGCA
jgi:hypothetical protein